MTQATRSSLMSVDTTLSANIDATQDYIPVASTTNFSTSVVAEVETTNNRMELMAAIKALEALSKPCKVRVTTDSVYVKNGITDWIDNWKKRNWRTANKKAVKNVDLWQQLDEVSALHKIEWCWVKGHSGHIENERADQLANTAIDNMLDSD